MLSTVSLDKILCCVPSKHAGSNSHPIRIGSEALAKNGPDDSCSLACFWIGSVWPKPDTLSQNQTGSGLVLHNMIWATWGRTQPGLKVGRWFLHTGLLQEQIQDVFDQNLTRPFRSDLSWVCTVWSRPSLEKQNQIGCGKSGLAFTIRPYSGCMLAIMAITGHNQNASKSDLTCLLGKYFNHDKICFTMLKKIF